jgi:hypothetical protein
LREREQTGRLVTVVVGQKNVGHRRWSALYLSAEGRGDGKKLPRELLKRE